MSEPVENLILRLNAKRSGKLWKAKCPAHDDQTPSLSISEGNDGRALVKCHAGCATDDVLAAIGLTAADLFVKWTSDKSPKLSGNGVKAPKPKPETALPFDWQKCNAAFTEKHVEQVAEWRGYSPDFVRGLRDTNNLDC